jgi:pimeloyl-ACP methyl ester carboxylesterase
LPALHHLGCYAEHATTDLVVCTSGNGCVFLKQYLCRFRNGRPSVAPHGDAADVVVRDLRGHGVTPRRRGDIDYINQFEFDLADLIKATAQPNQKDVVLGHSSAGGLVVRFAGGEYGEIINHAVLLAPFLKHNAPTPAKIQNDRHMYICDA